MTTAPTTIAQPKGNAPGKHLRRLTGRALTTLERVSPAAAGRLAFDLFCKPPSRRFQTAVERRALETLAANLTSATARRITTPDADIQTYRWDAKTAPSRGTVLLVHGWSAEARVMTLFLEPLRRAGFDVVALDFPAHGISGGRRLNMPIGARALLATGDAYGPFAGVIAHSFGGLATALAAEGGLPLNRRLAVDRLVLISTPHSLSRLVREFADGLGASGRVHDRLADAVTAAAHRPVNSITTGGMLAVAARPALIVQDDEDDIVPASDGPAIAAAAPLASLMTTRGFGHKRIVVMPPIVRAATRFLAGETPKGGLA